MTTPRRLLLPLLLGAFLVTPAHAAEEAPDTAVLAVGRLASVLDEPGASWEDVYLRYTEAKDAIGEEEDEATRTQAEADYSAIRERVAEALRRDRVPASGWFLGIFGALLLWGGFGYCLRIAMRSTPQHELDRDETWPIRPEEP